MRWAFLAHRVATRLPCPLVTQRLVAFISLNLGVEDKLYPRVKVDFWSIASLTPTVKRDIFVCPVLALTVRAPSLLSSVLRLGLERSRIVTPAPGSALRRGLRGRVPAA